MVIFHCYVSSPEGRAVVNHYILHTLEKPLVKYWSYLFRAHMEGLANYYGMNKLDPVRKRVRLQE